MTAWEYVCCVSDAWNDITRLGREGWEAFAVERSIMFFRRPVPTNVVTVDGDGFPIGGAR